MAATETRREGRGSGDARAVMRRAAMDGRDGDTEGDEGSGDARAGLGRAAKDGRDGDTEGGTRQRGQEGGTEESGHRWPRRNTERDGRA